MPYMTKMNGEKHCVYKKGDDDQPMGESMGCHDTAEEAQAQVDALYAQDKEKMPMMEMETQRELISELTKADFRGDYPEIPLPKDIDKSAFGESPMFVTLPIAKVGKSRNGYEYTPHAIQRIAEQINANRNEGRWGHLKAENRATEYKPPAVRWLAATVADDGTLWAKCVPIQEQAREHFRVAKASNASVGISVYGVGTFKGGQVVDFDLESVDLGDPARVGIKDASARPHITSEMSGENHMEENAVDEQTTQRNIAELTQENDGYKAQIAELTQERDTRQALIAELLSVAGVEKADDLKTVVSELITARNTAVETARKAIAARLVAEIKLPQTAALVADKLGVPGTDDEEQIKTQIAELLQSPLIQPFAEMERVKLGGPRALVGNDVTNKPGQARVDNETVQTAKSLFG